jgi:hypothetical protein
MKRIMLALVAATVVLFGVETAQAGPFARRLESNIAPAVDEAFRKVFLLDVLERLNRGSEKSDRPSTTSTPPAQAAPAMPESKAQAPSPQSTQRGIFRLRLFRR